jgi:hypothetical protein
MVAQCIFLTSTQKWVIVVDFRCCGITVGKTYHSLLGKKLLTGSGHCRLIRELIS